MAIITIGPNTPVLLYPATGETVLIANRDIANSIIVGPEQGMFNVQSGSIQYLDVTQIDPLAFTVFDGSEPIYGISLAGNVQVQVQPGASYWSASPAQVAASINALGLAKDTTLQTTNANTSATKSSVDNTNLSVIAQTAPSTTIANDVSNTGVPLLSKSVVILDTGAQVITTGSQFISSSVAFKQIGYEVFVQAIEASAGTPLNMIDIVMGWTDSTTGLTIASELWRLAPGNALSGNHTVLGSGPTKGDHLQITITNKDTVSCTVRVIIAQNSRVYPRDDWRTLSLPGIAGQTLPQIDILGNTIATRFVASLGIGATDTTILPLVAGTVRIHWDSGSNTSDCELVITAMDIASPALPVSGDTMYDKFSDGNGNGNDTWTLPRGECKVAITNHNAAAKQVRWTMVLDELS